MKKIFAILVMVLAIGMIAEAQTDYSPVILERATPYVNSPNDTLYIKVYQNIAGWDNKQLKVHQVRVMWKNDDAPFQIDRYTFHQLMDSTYTHTRDNGNEITQTGRWFVQVVFESGAINWALWEELGRSIYFEYWDINQEFIIKE